MQIQVDSLMLTPEAKHIVCDDFVNLKKLKKIYRNEKFFFDK